MNRFHLYSIPGVVTFGSGPGGLVKANVVTDWSEAEVYLHGAQLTFFRRHGEPPLLFLSSASRFASGKAIRGGVPICLPWFGPRPGDVAHGFARLTDWELLEAAELAEGGATLRFRLPPTPAAARWSALLAEFVVTVTDRLVLELRVSNTGSEEPLQFESCLHTYLHVGDVRQISVHGLEGVTYLDKTLSPSPERREAAPIRITAQTDRTYLDTAGAVLIRDPVLGRAIRVAKSGSASTVVWNPWTTQALSDLAPDEYLRMVCVESGNVERNRVRLGPGEASTMSVTLSIEPA